MSNLEQIAAELSAKISFDQSWLETQPNGRLSINTTALAALLAPALRSYGAERARAERERAADWLDRYAMRVREDASAELDDDYQLTLRTVASHFINAAEAIRELD